MSEAALHRAVAGYLRQALKPPTCWSTLGHGGGGRVRGAQLKAMGLQRGWPDILIVAPHHQSLAPTVLAIELKAKKGSQSVEQKSVQLSLEACGAFYRVCRSVFEVEVALDDAEIRKYARCA